MITTKRYLKLLSCNDEQLDQEIDKMSENDVRDCLKFFFKFMRNQTKPSDIYNDITK